MKIKVENTEELFNRCINFKHQIQSIAGIVQNNMIIDKKDGIDWLHRTNELIAEITVWKQDVMNHLWKNEVSEEQAEIFDRQLKENLKYKIKL